MPGFRHGAKRGIFLVMCVFLVALARVVPLVVDVGTLPPWAVPAASVLAAVSMGLTLKASKYWSYRYLAGFVVGIGVTLLILLQTQFLGLRELLLYGVAAVAAVLLRVKIHL